ncbi:MAG: hypothetical protein ACPGQL_02295 [Thermoplasmatota archaeon]
MARGVASNFLQILDGDARAAHRRIIILAVLLPVLAAPAYLLGDLVALGAHAVVGLLALPVGYLAGRSRYVGTFEASLKQTWNRWMRFAVSCETVPEVYRKVTGRSGRNLPYLYAALLTLLWAAEIVLLVVALAGSGAGLDLAALPVVIANAAVAGGLLGYQVKARNWCRTFVASVKEMMDDGELGVWGVI